MEEAEKGENLERERENDISSYILLSDCDGNCNGIRDPYYNPGGPLPFASAFGIHLSWCAYPLETAVDNGRLLRIQMVSANGFTLRFRHARADRARNGGGRFRID